MARIGWAACGVCGNPEAAISRNDAGTVSMRCHRCEFSGFGKAGTLAARKLLAGMKPDGEEGGGQGGAPAAADPAPAPPPKPAARSGTPAFDLSSLQ